MPKDKIKTANRTVKVQLSSDVDIGDAAPQGELRKFSGVAHTGKPFSYGGMQCVIELSSITHHAKLPVLLLHQHHQRAGFGALSVDKTLNIDGQLLKNEHGREVENDADAGFPWQLSAHIVSQTVDELAHGETETVNGQTVTGPMLVMRNSKCYEVSFTPLGVDSDTFAMVLSDDGTDVPTPQPTQSQTDKTGDDMTLEEALAALEAMKEQNEKLVEENEQLKEKAKKSDDAAHEAAVDAQLSQAGFTKDGDDWNGISAATYKVLLSADDASAKALIGDLPKPQGGDERTPPPAFLLSEQHGGGGQQQPAQTNPMLANAEARAASTQNYI